MEDAFGKLSFSMVDGPMLESQGPNLAVAQEFVRRNGRTRLDVGLNKRREGFTLNIVNNLRPDFTPSLGHTKNNRLAFGPASAFTFPDATDISLVGLHNPAQAAQRTAVGLHHHADLVQHSPSAFVCDAELSLKFLSGYSVLGVSNQKDRMKPGDKFCRRLMQDRSRRWIDLVSASARVGASVFNGIKVLLATLRARQSVRINFLEDERKTRFVVGEVFAEVVYSVSHVLKIAYV